MSDARDTAAANPAPRRHRYGWRSWEKAHHRAIMLVLEGVCALVAGLLVLVVLLAVRLDMAPLRLDFLTPQLVSWLDGQLKPLKVSINSTSLAWSWGRESLDLDMTGLKIVDPASGQSVVSMPDASAAISINPLFLGRVRPERLRVTDPRILLIRTRDGTLALPGLGPSTKPLGLTPASLLVHVDDIFSSAHRIDSGGYPLTTIIADGIIADVDDRVANRHWRIADGRLSLTGHREGFAADAQLKVSLAAKSDASTVAEAALDGHIDYVRSGEPVRVRLASTPVDLSQWADLSPTAGPWLARIHMPIGGNIEGQVRAPDEGEDWRLGDVSLNLAAGAGSVVHPYFVDGALKLKGATLAARYMAGTKHLAVDKLTADLGGPKAVLEAAFDNVPDDPAAFLGRLSANKPETAVTAADAVPFSFHVAGGPLDVGVLLKFWPEQFHEKPRSWIAEHILKGTVTQADFAQTLVLYPGFDKKIEKQKQTGTLLLQGVTVDYLHGLPPATDVDAIAHFPLDTTVFDVQDGRIDAFRMGKGQITIDKVRIPEVPSWLTLDLFLKGPAREAVSILESDRLHLGDALSFKPAQIDGTYDGTFHLYLPLVKDIPKDDVQFGAKGRLTDLVLRKAAPNVDVTGGDVALAVDNKAVTVEGTALLNGATSTLKFSRPIAGPPPHAMDISVQTVLDDAARQRLKLETASGALKGPVGLDMQWHGVDSRSATAAIDIDLSKADVTVDLVHWHKPANQPARTRFTAIVKDGNLAALHKLDVSGPGLSVKGDVDFDASGKVRSFNAEHLTLNASDAKGSVSQDNAGWHIMLSGNVIDLTGYMKSFGNKPEPKDRQDAAPLDISLDAGRLILGDKRELAEARLRMQFQHLNLMSGDIAGRAGKGAVRFRIARPEAGGQFSVRAADLGAVARLMAISDHIADGSLDLQGTAPMQGDHRRYIGHIAGKDYRVIGAPIMAKLLSVASFSSIASQLSGHGIPFDSLSADIIDDDGLISISHGHAEGNALGLNVEGQVDTNAKTLALKGSLVPANLINSALSHIPVVGPVIAGGKGQGVFSANFSVAGAIDDPTVLVNPLSIFAPGAIRNLPIFTAPILSDTGQARATPTKQ